MFYESLESQLKNNNQVKFLITVITLQSNKEQVGLQFCKHALS